MKIIVEGCDGSGKTTLVKHLAKIFNLEIEHDSTPQDYSHYMQRLNDGKNTIYDRFFLGQFIYNKPEERKLSEDDLDVLIHECHVHGHVLLYLDTPDKTILTRLKQRSEDEKQKDRAMMEKMGVTTLEEFVSTVKSRYAKYTLEFTKIEEVK